MDAALAVERRAEIRRALETIGCASTAKQIYSCCPAFADEAELRRELFAMSQDGLVRLVSEVSPARYALTGKEGAAPTPAAARPPMKVESVRGVDEPDDMPPVQLRRTGCAPAPIFPAVPAGPAPAAQPKEPVMPKAKNAKKGRVNTQELVLEALKASRDPLTSQVVAEVTKLDVKQVQNALSLLRKKRLAAAVGAEEGKAHAKLWTVGDGKPGRKKVQQKTAKSQRSAAVSPAASHAGGGAEVRIWLSSYGSMRLEKGSQVLDLTRRDAVALKDFMAKLAAIAP